MAGVVGSLRSVLAGIRPQGGSLSFLQGLGEVIKELEAGELWSGCVYSQTLFSHMAAFLFLALRGPAHTLSLAPSLLLFLCSLSLHLLLLSCYEQNAQGK